MSQFLQAAIELADLGYRVFPCKPGRKEPATKNGCLDATNDQEQIAEWWTENPNYNVAVSTDGLLVIDVDPKDDGSPNDYADDPEVRSDLLKNAGTATPRGGSHYWFRQPEIGDELRNTTKKIAPGVDTRATGGYVLAPPSVIEPNEDEGIVGGVYHWMFGFRLQSSPEFLDEPPAFVLDALGSVKKRSDAVILPTDGTIPDGQRNATLASLAGSLRRIGLSQQAIEASLRETNAERCKPPLNDEEVRKIAWSVGRYQPDQIATAVAEGWAQQDEETSHRAKLKDPGKIPEELLNPGGFLGEIIEWNLSTAYKPQPELALAAALCLLSVITGRKVQDETGTRTNVYCLGVCESGGGKEHARKVNKSILRSAGLEKFIGPEGIGSHAGILSHLNVNPALLFQLDEFGRMLLTLNNPSKSPHLYNVITVLLKLYSSSDTIFVGDAVADIKRVPQIDQPHAVVYGTSIPSNFLSSLEKSSLEDGFVGRLLVFTASNNDPDTQDTLRESTPEHLTEQAAWWGAYQPGGNLSGINPQPRCLRYSPDAKALFREFDVVCRANAKNGGEGSRLWTRTVEKARKLALLHAVSADRDSDEIGEESAEWGSWIAHHLSKRMEYLASDWVSENQYEASMKRITRLIKYAGSQGASLTEISRATQWLTSKARSEVLSNLELSGVIYQERTTTSGRPKLVYKAIGHAEQVQAPQ